LGAGQGRRRGGGARLRGGRGRGDRGERGGRRGGGPRVGSGGGRRREAARTWIARPRFSPRPTATEQAEHEEPSHPQGFLHAGVAVVPSGQCQAAADGPPREVVHDFTVRSVTPRTWPDGAAKKGGMILVNGSLPGPTIRAREGDTVVVRLRNGLPEGTSIHWH